MPEVTFTVTGRLADFGEDPFVGATVTAVATPHMKIGTDTIFSNRPEPVVTDEDGEFTLELVSLPGLWYKITAGRATNPVRLAAYTPDGLDPTTGTVFAPDTVINLRDVMDESPTPGYQGVLIGGVSGADLDAAVAALEAADAAEAGTRAASDASLLATIGAETTARTLTDTAHDARLDALEAAPGPDLSGLATDAELAAEASTRLAADNALDGRVDALEAAPPPDLSGLATDAELAAEASARAGADTALDSRVDALEAAPFPAYADLTDVDLTGLANGDIPVWDSTAGKWEPGTVPGGGVTDHGALTGLGDDDHTQYALADGSRGAFATTAQGAKADTAVQPAALTAHESDTTAIHGIADTSALVVTTDGRLTDARTPTAHASSHATAGSDPVSAASIGAAAASHSHAIADTTGLQAAIDAKAPLAQTINAQTGTSYAAVAGDAGKVVTLTNAAAIALSIPGSVFTAGQRVDFIVMGAGMVTVAGSAGATVNGTPSLVSRAQHSAFSAICLSPTSFVVVGDMA